jgi:trimethylamine monooxygenase
MYRYLWSNGPKECLEFADYSFKEHFGKPIPSYPPREVLHDYINGRIEKSNIKDWIHLNTVISSVKFHAETNDFEVTIVKNTTNGPVTTAEERTERFDWVFTCTGHFHVPNVPYFDGIEKFQGRVLHSHDFREACEFTNQRIMVIGASYSAEDIAS